MVQKPIEESLVELVGEGAYVRPLWAHVAHVDHPRSLFFIGLNLRILPFVTFDRQCRFTLSLLMMGTEKAPSPTASSWPTRESVADDEHRRLEWDYFLFR
jgi:hypothetical protein